MARTEIRKMIRFTRTAKARQKLFLKKNPKNNLNPDSKFLPFCMIFAPKSLRLMGLELPMPIYQYRALNQQGIESKGFTLAGNAPALRSKLQRRSLHLLSWQEIHFAKTLSLETKRDLFYELAGLLEAGINLSDALATLKSASQKHTALWTDWEKAIHSGKPLSQSVYQTEGLDNPLIVKMLEVGEGTGNLAKSTSQVARYYDHLASLKSKIISALIYPSIVLTVSVAAIFILAFYVIPMFLDMFQRYGVNLPLITKFLLAFAQTFTRFGWIAFLGTILLLLVGRAKKLHHHPRFFQLVNKIPGLNKVLTLFRNLTLLEAMGNLVEADVRVHDALGLLRGIFRDPTTNEKLQEVYRRVVKGGKLGSTLQECQLLGPKDHKLIAIGEETGDLATQLNHLSKAYHRQVDLLMERAMSLFEPVMIVLLSGLIGFILVGLYLPLFDILSGPSLR